MSAQIQFQQLLEQVTSKACENLFSHYGVVVRQTGEREDPVSPDFLLCSVIGFTGRNVRGTLMLAVTEDLTGLSNPVSGTDPAAGTAPVMRRDWVGELANQLLGQIKIELLRWGIEIYLNLPAVLLGQHLAPLPRAQLKPLKLTLAKGAAAVWVEAEAAPGLKIEADPAEGGGPSAGEALIFD